MIDNTWLIIIGCVIFILTVGTILKGTERGS